MHTYSKSVSSGLAQMALEAAKHSGVGPQEFQRLTGISESEAREAGGRIPAAKHIAMLNLMERDFKPLGLLESSAHIPLCASISTLLGMVTNAPSLTAAYAGFLEYRVLVGDVDGLALRRDGADFEFEYCLDGEGRTAVSAFGNLVMLARLARQYAEGSPCSIAMELTGPAFAPVGQLRHIDPCEIRFGQERNCIRIRTQAPDRPYSRFNATTHGIIGRQAHNDLQALNQKYSFALRVEGFLVQWVQAQQAFPVGHNALEQVCDKFAMTRWGIHRRLQKESINFQHILSRVKMAEAKRLLLQSDAAISDVSDMLGFSSPSAFSRFFSDQHGVSPSRYKTSHYLS
ncbi:helix-turn-helix domain-containing protein [Rhodoferax sp. WC2427]|uniref:helix-turn-helix transcriptional regulator n=1 Tax=Rhodoferax sp. WC2427 TaxID=3234144 RepID=UPI0034664C7A